ncbi:MAG: ABC transporter substrate-binding protein [Candidatus Promineofilum sp.]|uniref:ABC transporter substrate-binding protein n=1 Tax=Promineifilum sp. TaxID=2664178 RepID=UPI002411B97A|nr:ABC transporter substrate-binding protein [Promineifilum sp.]MCO5181980.1 ABC transporter substrate-binding protein [Promineifilum sp.]
MKRILIILFVILTAALVACGAPEAAPDELTTLRLPMGYIADPQYAPFYVAVERGYFADEGLALEFDYSFETDGIALVGAGELPLAVASGEQVILARAQGLPVVYVMQWWQRYPIAIASKSTAGIKTPADLVGRNVGVPGFFGASYVGLVGLLSANGLTLDDIDANDIGFNQVESLVTGQSEAVVVYVNNEPVQLRQRGEDIDVIAVADSIDLVANGILTNEQTIAENPELVQRFLNAFMHGLRDTLADPDAAYEISKKYVEGLDDSRRGVLEASLPLWQADQLGRTNPAAWQQTQDILIEMGLLSAPLPDLAATFTNDFVDSIGK